MLRKRVIESAGLSWNWNRGRYAVALVVALACGGAKVEAQQFVDETTSRLPNPQLTEYSNQCAIADIDGDGDLDLAFANGSGFFTAQQPQRVRLFINDGTGNFTDESIARTGNLVSYARDVQFGDVDGDGDLDMVVANDFNSLQRLFINDGSGFFTYEPSRLPNLTISSPHVALGDVDNDGDLDLWFPNGGLSRFGSGQSQLWINDGTGNFTDETNTRLPAALVPEPMDAIFGDVDGDFDLDCVEGHRETNQSRLYINDGLGNFTNVPFPNDGCTYSYDFGDIDGDGDLDLLGANSLPNSSREMILVNDGTGNFQNQTALRLPNSSNPNVDDNDSKFLDIDMDGDLDFLIASLGSAERVCFNNGQGMFNLVSGTIQVIGDSSLDIEVGDLDGNGTHDVVTAQGESGSFVNRIYMNSGAPDTIAPNFPSLEQLPDTDDTSGPYVVRVVIRDQMTSDSGFFRASATLSYTVNGGTPVEIPLMHAGHDMFRAEIPGQPAGSIISYEANATDWNNNSGTSSSRSFTVTGAGPQFIRGDANSSGGLDAIADALFILNFGFLAGSPVPECFDAADVDDNGQVEPLVDAIYILTYGFAAGPEPLPPFPGCGEDPTDDALDCAIPSGLCP